MKKERILARALVRHYFKNDEGLPFEMSEGQTDLFLQIFLKTNNRVEVIAPTQYGKSSVIAMALCLRTRIKKEQFAIVCGQEAKAQIIMEKVIQHTFDHPFFYKALDIDKNEPLDRIRRERSKKRIMWKGGGEIRTFTADSKNRQRVKEALSGFGCPNIIEDEASLIPDDLQSMVLRMLGGHKNNFLCKVGNPYNRGHFLKSWESNRYYKIFIDYKQALREGRYSQEFIDEMKEEYFFDILYRCKFPQDNEIDIMGYLRLISDEDILRAKKFGKHKGMMKLGFDVGEGGDENVGILRSEEFAEIVHISKTKDLMATVRQIEILINKFKVEPENCFVDKTGIGAGVVSRLHELGIEVSGISWGDKAKGEGYANLKAQNFWETRRWLKGEVSLNPKDNWNELTIIKYKEDSSGRVKIKSKDEMRKEGIKSPNIADALALSFNNYYESEPNIVVL